MDEDDTLIFGQFASVYFVDVDAGPDAFAEQTVAALLPYERVTPELNVQFTVTENHMVSAFLCRSAKRRHTGRTQVGQGEGRRPVCVIFFVALVVVRFVTPFVSLCGGGVKTRFLLFLRKRERHQKAQTDGACGYRPASFHCARTQGVLFLIELTCGMPQFSLVASLAPLAIPTPADPQVLTLTEFTGISKNGKKKETQKTFTQACTTVHAEL